MCDCDQSEQAAGSDKIGSQWDLTVKDAPFTLISRVEERQHTNVHPSGTLHVIYRYPDDDLCVVCREEIHARAGEWPQ